MTSGDFGERRDNLPHSSYKADVSQMLSCSGEGGTRTVWLLSSIVCLYSEQNVNVVLRGQLLYLRREKFGDRRTSHTFPSRIQFSQAGLSTTISFRFSHSQQDRAILPSLHFRLLALDN